MYSCSSFSAQYLVALSHGKQDCVGSTKSSSLLSTYVLCITPFSGCIPPPLRHGVGFFGLDNRSQHKPTLLVSVQFCQKSVWYNA